MPTFVDSVPPGKATTIRIIDSTTRIGNLKVDVLMEPEMPGMEVMPDLPTWSFLIEHESGRRLLFDLGVPVDWRNLAPATSDRLKTNGWEINIQKSTVEILNDGDVDVHNVEAIIWSHFHWDHIGNPSQFPPSTALIVGPGFKSDPILYPGYPTNSKSKLRDIDWAGRELRQIDFSPNDPATIQIGPFRAHDYFGDGSFYLLDTPGHATGHLGGLARTSSSTDPGNTDTSTSRDTFILMGGDLSHHSGELRPSTHLPLPTSPPSKSLSHLIPLQTSRQRIPEQTTPFFDPAMGTDMSAVRETIAKTKIADADDNVLYIFAHDTKVREVVDLFPKSANGWFERGWREKMLWSFVEDFDGALRRVGCPGADEEGGSDAVDGKL